MSRVILCLVVACLLVIPALGQGAGPDPESPLELSVEAGLLEIEIQGATPGAEIVILGVSRNIDGFVPTTIRTERIVAADAAGAAVVTVRDPIAAHSVWFAVDLEAGSWAIAGPEGTELRRIQKPGRGLGETQRFLEDQRQFLHLMVARPADGPGNGDGGASESGAWGEWLRDGGQKDVDGAVDGRIRLRLLDLRSITDGPAAPERLAPGDVVIGVDSLDLRFYAQRLASPEEGAGSAGSGQALGGER